MNEGEIDPTVANGTVSSTVSLLGGSVPAQSIDSETVPIPKKSQSSRLLDMKDRGYRKKFMGTEADFQAYLDGIVEAPSGSKSHRRLTVQLIALTRRMAALKKEFPKLDMFFWSRGGHGAEREYFTDDYIGKITETNHELYEQMIKYFRDGPSGDSNHGTIAKPSVDVAEYRNRFNETFAEEEATFELAWKKIKSCNFRSIRRIYFKLAKQQFLNLPKFNRLIEADVWPALETLFQRTSTISAAQIWKASSVISDKNISTISTADYIKYMQSLDILAKARQENPLPKDMTTDGQKILSIDREMNSTIVQTSDVVSTTAEEDSPELVVQISDVLVDNLSTIAEEHNPESAVQISEVLGGNFSTIAEKDGNPELVPSLLDFTSNETGIDYPQTVENLSIISSTNIGLPNDEIDNIVEAVQEATNQRNSISVTPKKRKAVSPLENYLESDEEEFELEKIVERRYIAKKKLLQFKCRWVNHEESDDTWEPFENLSNSVLLIREFEKNELNKIASRKGRGKAVEYLCHWNYLKKGIWEPATNFTYNDLVEEYNRKNPFLKKKIKRKSS